MTPTPGEFPLIFVERGITFIEILAIILAPTIAVVLSIILTEWSRRRREEMHTRREVFRNLIENRYATTRPEFLKAMNSIPIVFANYPEVRNKKNEFFDAVQKNDPNKDQILWSLLLEISKNVGHKNIDEDDIRKVFKF